MPREPCCPWQGHREGSGLVQWRWPARLPSLGHLPSPLRSRDIRLLPAVSRSTSVHHVTLCDTISFQGVGAGWGSPSHESVMSLGFLVGLSLRHLSPLLAHRAHPADVRPASE